MFLLKAFHQVYTLLHFIQESEQANSNCASDCDNFGLLHQSDILTHVPQDATPHQKQVCITPALVLHPETSSDCGTQRL